MKYLAEIYDIDYIVYVHFVYSLKFDPQKDNLWTLFLQGSFAIYPSYNIWILSSVFN